MTQYLIRRLLLAIPTLLVISMVVYAILALAPTDPLSQFAANPAIPATVREKLGELQRSLRAAIFADAPDTAQIDQLRASIAEAEAAALAARVDLQLKIAQILTPEQRQQARESAGRGPRGH